MVTEPEPFFTSTPLMGTLDAESENNWGAKHTLKNVLDNTLEEEVVIWETGRPETNLPPFLTGEYDEAHDREEFIQHLKLFLHAIPPYNDDHNQCWNWIEETALDSEVADI